MDSIHVLQGIAWGTAAGIFFFGGLWKTVRSVPDTARPGRLLLASALVRFPISLACFWAALQNSTMTFGTAFLIFLLTRFLVIGKIRQPQTERSHAH